MLEVFEKCSAESGSLRSLKEREREGKKGFIYS